MERHRHHSIRHVGIVVSDLESSLRFYADLLGLKIVKKEFETGNYLEKMLGIPHVAVTTVKFEEGLELLHYTRPSRIPNNRKAINQIGLSHIALTVQNLPDLFNRLHDSGILFQSEPINSGKVRVCFCFDPDYNPIELVEEL